jgi:ferritin
MIKKIKGNYMKTKLYYEEEGLENKKAIIFLHSNLMSNWIWNMQKGKFKDYHCIYLDILNHGKSKSNEKFSIAKTTELIKDFIENDLSNKEINLIGIAIGGQIIINLLNKYPKLIKTAIITGVNIKNSQIATTEEKIFKENKRITELLNSIKQCKKDILDKKPENFIVKGYLAEYNIGNSYFKNIKESIKNINNMSTSNLINITEKSLKFRINTDNDDKNNFKNLLILYGTKEYPKVQKSAKIIKKQFLNAKIYSVYRAIHLWNIINYEWFNKIAIEFIEEQKINKKDKKYLKEVIY